MATAPVRAVNLALQQVAIQRAVPHASVGVHHGELTCIVQLQPTEASRIYTVRLVYRIGRTPDVTIVDPPLRTRPDAASVPHVYVGDRLCLYRPGEWNAGRMLASTILPWTAEWLLHYEMWLATGTWHGGGTVHSSPRPKRPIRGWTR